MFSRSMTATSTELRRSENLITYIVTNNYNKVKELITSTNVNNIIDNTNKMTALHYSLQVPDSKITNFLLDMGADARIKNSSGQDSYQLALDLHRKCIYEYEIKNLKKKITDLESINRDINNILDNKIESIDYLTKSIDNYREKIKNLEREIILMESDIHQLKEMNNRLKRKNEELSDSVEGLINSKRK